MNLTKFINKYYKILIIIKTLKMKYSLAIAFLLGSASAVKLQKHHHHHKHDIRGPTTDGPTAGVY